MLALLFAFPNPLAPIITLVAAVITRIDAVTHNIGWSLVVLAALISAALWPVRDKQYRSAAAMQQLAPEIGKLKAKYKDDPQRLNTATMELYKERGVNPLASCLPMLIQLPLLISVYQAINSDRAAFNGAHWLWIGTPFSLAAPFHILATSLVAPDYVLLVLYIVSMYFSFKLASPATDPQQAKQQQMMAFISPALIGYFALQNKWPSALIVYWLSTNLFSMSQQFFVMRGRRAAAANALAAGPVVDVPAAQAAKGMRGGSGGASRKGSIGSPAAAKAVTAAKGANGSGSGQAKTSVGKSGGTTGTAKRRR